MRNLKRALSLTLASVMLLGMMVVGSSAAAGYSDVDAEDNVEAIEVLQAVEVMVGDDRGFGPDRPVTRAEMAVVMGKLLSLDYNYYVSTCPFADVSGNFDWAKGWVGACAANGIVSGRGDGIYDPAATVTAVEAASMMMRALGYFRYQNDYADGFMVSTVRQGTKIGIFEGVGTDAATPMTRNQVAQMALNALKSGMVEPDGNTINLTTPDGAVFTGKVNYVFVTSAKPYATAISSVQATAVGSQNGGPIVELGEQLYNGSLKLNEGTMDDFYRPTRTWEYDSKTIGSYVKQELLKAEYTDKVTGRMLYDLLTKGVIENYDFEIAIDGVNTGDAGARGILTDLDGDESYFTTSSLVRSNTDGVGRTGKGVLTQVFVDDSKDVEKVYIAVINTYLAIADKDYDAKRDEVTLTGYNMDKKGSIYIKDEDDDDKLIVDGEDFAIEDVKKDDKFLVTVADGSVQSMIKPEVLSEVTINAFKRDTWVNADGTQYDHATTARYDVEVLDQYDNVNMKEVTYNVVLDKYGYLIGLELNEKANQYVFVTGTDDGESNLTAKNANVNVIFLDGTMDTIVVNTRDSVVDWKAGGKNASQVNTWCTYSKNSNDVYTLKEVGYDSTNTATSYKFPKKIAQSAMDANPATFDINTKNVSLDGSKVRFDDTTVDAANPNGWVGDFTRVYGNDDTVYINTEMEEITVKDGGKKMVIVKDVDSVTTGVKNVDFTVVNHTKTAAAGHEECAANEAYILYNKDGYIISVVTLAADDKGTSAQYAYITGDVKREEYLGNDEWKWTQDAIINGKKVELTEVDDSSAWLDTTEIGNWYEVRFNSKGDVAGLKENVPVAGVADTRPSTEVNNIYFDFTKDRFINDMNEIVNAVNGKNGYESSKTVLLFVDYCTNNTGTHVAADSARADLSFKNGTLYTDTAQTEGFSVSPNVNVVLALAAKNHGDAFDDVDDNYTGYTGVETALKNLDKSADKFDGFLCAVIEDGAATSIIFDERAGANRTNLEPVKPMVVTVNKVDTNGNQLGTETFNWNGAPFTGSEVTAPANYTWQSATSLTFVEGQTGTVTFTYKSNSAITAPDNAVALYDGGTNAFAVLYSGAGTAPTGNGLAALLIDAAKAAGFPNAKATRVTTPAAGWKITDNTGVIGLDVTFADSAANAAWVGKVNDETVYIKKGTALNALTTFGNSNLTEALKGTYVDATSAGTGLTDAATNSVTQDSTKYYALAAGVTVTGDGFDLTDGFVGVIGGIDGGSGVKVVPYGVLYTAPAKSVMNDTAAAKGTGMTYTVAGGTAKYLPYGGTIPADEVTNNITLAKDKVEVKFELSAALTAAGWTIDADGTNTTKYISAAASQNLVVDLINTGASKPTGSTVTAADQKYATSGAVTTATGTASTGTSSYTPATGKLKLDLANGAFAAGTLADDDAVLTVTIEAISITA